MIVNKKCAECGKEFEYDEKPGYPRKYCFSCGAAKKASFAGKQDINVPVVKPGEVKTIAESGDKFVNPHATMYVSYAKDIFLGLKDFDPKERMETAIRLVKQAKEAFE